MEWIEITAKTVDEAKNLALDELGIDRDEAEFVIVEEPRQGLFRQVRGTARVRARVAPRTPRAKADRRPKNTRSNQEDRPAKSEGSDRSSRSGASTPPRNNRGKRPANGKRPNPQKSPASTTQSNQEEGPIVTMTLEDQIAAAENFLTEFLNVAGFTGSVSTTRTDDANAHVNISGDELGLLIGPRGQTMNAIQDLTRVALQKQAAGSWEGHVHVDVNGYRAKRREALVRFVTTIAEEVRATGTPKALEPMSASDRKAVHDTINALDGVHTSSEGHEPRRWVEIAPGDA